MSDYFDQVERDLRTAVRRRVHLPWYLRLQARYPRGLIVVIAGLLVAGPALAAVGLLQSGSPVASNVPATPTANNGVALSSGVRLLPVRARDARSGLPWGMRRTTTTRGLLCLQVGRLAFGTVGALGRDGAFGNDGRFHPFSANYNTGPPCLVPDAHGNGFLNVEQFGVPASGLFGDSRGCQTPQAPPRPVLANARRATLRRVRHLRHGQLLICPAADLRDISYGLLGPDAVSITYTSASGRLVTTRTAGTDGAYLIVLPGHAYSAENNGFTYDARLLPGVVRAVTYRDGHTCRVPASTTHHAFGSGSCPPVGYASPPQPAPSPAQIASQVTARVVSAKHYCDNIELAVPCPGPIPPGFRRMNMSHGPAVVLAQISFVSRVPITNGHSYYYLEMSRAPHPDRRYRPRLECGRGASDFGQTNSDYHAGQRVLFSLFENLSCRGVVQGNVTLVITTGPSAPAPMPAVPGQSVGREVGHFSLTVP